LQAVSHRTLSGARSNNQIALDDLFTQVLGMLSAEGLITLERVTLDGTKIKANAGGNSFRRQEKIARPAPGGVLRDNVPAGWRRRYEKYNVCSGKKSTTAKRFQHVPPAPIRRPM
jgi:hypothetical protein